MASFTNDKHNNVFFDILNVICYSHDEVNNLEIGCKRDEKNKKN